LLQEANPEQDDPDSWNYDGWQADFISFDKYTYDSNSDTESLKGFVDYLFESIIARKATVSEQRLFKEHMIESRDGKQLFRYEFNMFVTYDDLDIQHEEREERKGNIAIIVLDYISRLDLTYRQREVH
jgi:hypothetical protein